MISKTLTSAALLWALALPAAAQHVTETTLPLQDPAPQGFYFLRSGIGLVVKYDGNDKVDARITALNLASAAQLWHNSVRVQESGDSPGHFLTVGRNNRLYLGNGPLTVLDGASGRTLWALDCKTTGSIDINDAEFFPDGDFLLQGTDGCGNFDTPRILRVNDSTGAVRWQVNAEAHEYKTGGRNNRTEHRDFAMFWSGTVDAAAVQDGITQATPARIILAGERLSAVDYMTGQSAWSVRDKPGRIVRTKVPGMSLWFKDNNITAYSDHDGTRLWSVDVDAPWGLVSLADAAAPSTSDLILVTWKGAFRIDRAGHQKWSVQREDHGWGQNINGQLLVIWQKRHHYSGVDLATGAVRWTGTLDTPGNTSQVDSTLSTARSGVVLIATYSDRTGPYGLNAFDATTGQMLWQTDKIDGDKIASYIIVDSTRLIVTADGPDHDQMEIDLRTGTATELGHVSRSQATGHYRVSYSRKRKTLTCRDPNGQVVWTRTGRLSENADFELLAQGGGVVVWPTQDGKVELIALTSGTSLYIATGDDKPRVGVDDDGGHVLVPAGKQIKILTVTAGS